jgi:HAD superfamily phosphatase (TIGR01681 family)
VIGDGAVHIDWLSYGSLSEPSQWLQVVAPDDESSGHPAVDLLVLLVRVSDLEAAHPELQSSGNAEAQRDCAESSGPVSADDVFAIPPQLDAFASDIEFYAALPRVRPPVVVLFCPSPPLLAARHEQLELRAAQRLGQSANHAIEVLPSSLLRDLFQWHYCDPNETNAAPVYYDAVGDHREHAPFTWRMQRVLALAICRHVRRVFLSPANAKKCIVLDCDNTLWGGAVAEVGAHALDLSPRFVALQRFVLEQQRVRGLVVCLCSKNIHADVDAAFQERRSDMPLRMDEHIATAKIDWSPKSHNIRAIADELSLGE